MNAFDQLDALTAQAPAGASGGAPPEAPPEAPSEFMKSLRNNSLMMGSQANTFAGALGGVTGHNDFAQGRYAQAAAMKAEAEKDPTRVQSYKAVVADPSWSNLRDYGEGLIGGAVPSLAMGVGAGLVGAATRGKINPMLLGTALQAPTEIGDVLQRQQADPAAQLRSPSDNLRSAALTGVTSAALGNIFPAAVGGQLAGATVRGAEGAAARAAISKSGTLTGMLGAGAEGAATNAVAGAAGEAAKQHGANGDAPLDWGPIAEAGVGGGLVAAPLGAVGHLAERGHAAPSNIIDSVTSGVKDAYASAKTAVGSAADSVSNAAGKMMDSGPTHTPEEVAGWHDSINAGMDKSVVTGSMGERSDAAKASFNNIMADPDVPTAVKDQAKVFRENPGDKTAQAWMQSAEKVADSARAHKASMAEPDAKPDTLGDLHSAINEDPTTDNVAAGGSANTDAQNEAFRNATDPQDIRAQSDSTFARTTQWARDAAASLAKRADLDPETRSRVDGFLKNAGDGADSAWIATQKKAMEAKDTVVSHAEDALRALDRFKTKQGLNGDTTTVDGETRDVSNQLYGPKRSEDLSGVKAVIASKLVGHVPKELLADPVARNKVADAVRGFIAAAAGDDIHKVNAATEAMRGMLGAKTEEVLADVYKAVGDTDPKARERFSRRMLEMKQGSERHQSLETALNVNLPDDRALSDGALKRLANTLKKWATGRDVDGLTPSEAQLHHQRVREYVEQTYGPKADAVFKALEGHAATEEAVPGQERRAPSESDNAHAAEDGGSQRGVDASREAGAEHGELTEGASLNGQDETTNYYGGGKDREAMQLMQSPASYDAKFKEYEGKGPVDKLIAKLKGQNPNGMDVRFLSEREYNARQGETGGALDHGYVVVEGMKDKDALSEREYNSLKLDANKFSTSPARMEFADKNGQKTILDAVKLTNKYLKLQPEGSGLSDKARAGRAFMEGVAAVQQLHGAFEIPDSVVIDKRGTTFGEAKQARIDTAENRMGRESQNALEKYRAEYRKADPERRAEITEKVRDLLQDEHDKELSGGPTESMLRDVDRSTATEKRAAFADKIEGIADREQISTEAALKLWRERTAVPDMAMQRLDQAAGLYNADGTVTKGAAINALGDAHGGIDTGKVQSRDREGAGVREENKRARTTGPQTETGVGASEQRRVMRAERETMRDTPSAVSGERGRMDERNPSGAEGSGRTKANNDQNIHQAAAEFGSDLGRSANMDGSPHFISDKQPLDTKPTMNAIRKLGGDGTAIGRKIADRATKLLDNVAAMSRADQERLLGLKDAKYDKRVLGISGLSPSETAAIVNDLARKYKDVIAAPKGETLTGERTSSAGGKTAQAPGDVRPRPPTRAEREAAVASGTTAFSDGHGAEPLGSAEQARGRSLSPGVDAQGRVTGGSESPEMTIKKFRDAQEEAAMKPLGGETAAERAQREQFGSNPSPKAEAAKKAALLQAASSSDPALLKELRTTDNAKGLQRTVDELSKSAPDSKALEVANNRIDALVQNPDVAYSLAAVHSKEGVDKTAQGPTNRAEARAYLDKTLGDSVRSVLDAAIGHAGEYIHAEKLIRISVHALNPLSVAYHESLHALVAQLRDWGLHDVSKVLLKAANEDYAIKQLNEHFKDQPEVLKQIAGDAEERAAYMYQLYQQGKFKVGPETKGVFGKIADFIRGALGIWSNDERAIHIMDYFSSGEYAESIGKPNEIFAKTMEGGRNKAVDMLASMAEPFVNMGEHVFAAGQAQLRDMGNSHISKITDLVKPLHTDSGKDTGFLAAARNERAAAMNKLTGALNSLSKEHMAQALEQLQTGTKAEASEARLAAFAVKRALRGVYDYMGKAGLDVGDLGKDYFPRVWDANAISKSQDQFKLMLERNGVADSEAVMKRIIANDGNSFDVDTRMPGFQSGKARVLSQISGTDASPFQNKNMLDTLNSYVGQATRRAEFARRFGADGKGLDKMMVDAKANGATKDQLQTVEKYMKGVTGTLGDGINPTARRMIGNMIVYQNLRLLPLAVFSSMPDALGIVVRGGSVSDAFSTFKRGFGEMAKNFKSYDPTAAKDWQTKAAETLGVIDNAMLTHAIGASYTQGMVSETGRAVNDTLFKFNLMEQYNNSMRAGATGAAIHFIQEHGGEGAGKHSARYLSELGLSKSDVKLDSHGHLMIDEASGLSPEVAVKMRDAVNKWVDGAVLRPDAADKPIWMNDPHFALFAHLKQFMYSFHHTVLTRVAHEANHGNYTPALALASYVPMMIAADAAKGLIQGGGSTPDWKEGWGPGDYLWNGLQRAGLFGVGQTAIDAVADVHRGGSGFGALTGPTVEQLTDLVKTVGGSERAGTFALHSMPANALYGSMFKGAKGAADPMFAD